MLVSVNRVTGSDREGKRLLRILGLVALGGVLGAVARALIEAAWPHGPDTIGWATLVVNVSGCFLIGLLLGAIGRYRPEQEMIRPFLGVGVLGGWTTFSAFAVDVLEQARSGHGGLAAAYVVVSVLLGVAAVGLGTVGGQRIWEHESGNPA
jgi:CrcB protein